MPVLIAVMKKHQRYFPVFGEDNDYTQANLLPYFVTVANSNKSGPTRRGHRRQRRRDPGAARRRRLLLSPGHRPPLESFTPRLGTLTFHAKLGSMLDKVNRLKALAPQVAVMLRRR